MINLKRLLKEVTDNNFEMKYVKDKNANKVIDVLQDLGFGVGRGDVAATNKRLSTYEGGKMFKHIQYHVVQGSGFPPEVYFIHQTQHYLTGENVDATLIYLAKYAKDYKKTSDKKVEIGRVLVPTKKFLKGLNRLTILDRAS